MDKNKIYRGDALSVLKTFPDESINCCITSPPYYAMRSYLPSDHSDKKFELGNEPSPDLYVNKLADICDEIKRVLRKDGTFWLNLGDAYAGSWGNAGRRPELDGSSSRQRKKNTEYLPRRAWDNRRERPPTSYKLPGLKKKDLIGLPWMVAFELRRRGWWLRSDIIWAKKNPMPESVRDRPMRSHEYIFLLTKSMRYHYDVDAMKAVDMKKRRDVWNITVKPFKSAHFAVFPEELVRVCVITGCPYGGVVLDPFMGSGTTAVVSKKLGRDYVGIELFEEYCEIAENRIKEVAV